jgi:Tol biopolymer transport system component
MMDIVGYSKLPIDFQAKLFRELQEAVSGTEAVRKADAASKLIKIPTGDGMALVFRGDPEAPATCALELTEALHAHPEISLRIGLNTGPVYFMNDINANLNVAGGGINFAQRVMDCGDGGHILVSQELASTLRQISGWADLLHDIGQATVKHGVRLRLCNLYRTDVGNPRIPAKLRAAKRRTRARNSMLAIGVAAVLASLATWMVNRREVGPQEADPVTRNGTDLPVNAAALSPDGKCLAYVDRHGIHLTDPDAREKPGSPYRPADPQFNFANDLGWAMTWSPDSLNLLITGPVQDEKQNSAWILTVSNGSLGSVRRLHENASLLAVSNDRRLAFTDDATDGELWTMQLDGENLRRIIDPVRGRNILELAWAPDGKRLAFIEDDSKEEGSEEISLRTIKDDGTEPKVLLANPALGGGPDRDISGLCFTQDGSLIYALQASGKSKRSRILNLKVDMATGEAAGDPKEIYSADGYYFSDISAAPEENRLYFLRLRLNYRLEVTELESGKSSPLVTQQGANLPSGWSRDSRMIFFSSDSNGISDIFRLNRKDESIKPILQKSSPRYGAQASPDGQWILYWSWQAQEGDEPKHRTLMRTRTSGSIPEEVLSNEPAKTKFSCSNSSCVLSREHDNSLEFFALDPVRRTLQPIGRMNAELPEEYDWDVSPDGLRIALVRAADKKARIQIMEIATGKLHEVPLGSFYRISDVAWARPNGQSLFVAAKAGDIAELLAVSQEGGSRVLREEQREDMAWPVPSPDGKSLAFARSEVPDSNVYRLKEF